MSQQNRTLEDYKRLPYTIYSQPVRDSDGSQYWLAEYIELPGCKTEGETEGDSIANLQELFDEYISARIESSFDIPEPLPAGKSIIESKRVIIYRKQLVTLPPDTEETRETATDGDYEHVGDESMSFS